MNWFTNAASRAYNFVKGLLTSPEAQSKALAALNSAGSIAAAIYPVIEGIAAMTPNRTDDEIVACINKYGLLGIVNPNNQDKAGTLHEIALNVAKNTVASTVASSTISLGIELAYQAYQANAKPKAA